MACRNGVNDNCHTQMGLLFNAFRTYDKNKDAINSETRSEFIDIANRLAEKRHQYFEELGKEALTNIAKDTVKTPAELASIIYRAKNGDEDAQDQLLTIGKAIGQFANSPLDTISTHFKNELEEADRLEAEGKVREADLKRIETIMSAEINAMSMLTAGAGIIKSQANIVGKLSLKSGVLSNKDIGIVWGIIDKQGKSWEAYLEKALPKGTLDLNTIKPNFKTFDKLLPDGTVISAKTMDTVGSKTYQNPKRITYQLNKYVDDMVNFKGDGKDKFELRNDKIKGKEIYLAIPHSTTKPQWEAINKSIDYAESQGVKIIVKEVK
ncbi:hypothetical protein A1D29_05705 [Pasteurellaceae bacterium Orientalotternb1]|nr:hypothetical protein A1D29_05705 [Pasteurellaceae bacterium Orientalotternb1]